MDERMWYILNYIPILPGTYKVTEISEREFKKSAEDVFGMNILLPRRDERHLKKLVPSIEPFRLAENKRIQKELIEDAIISQIHDEESENALLIMKQIGGRLRSKYRYYCCTYQCNCNDEEKVEQPE